MNETIAKGVIYIEYVSDEGAQFIFTKNHGETWEGPIILGNISGIGFASAFCGKRGKGRIFATMPKMFGGKTIYFDIDDNKLRVSDYPFGQIVLTGVQSMDCTYDEKQGKYTLALMCAQGFFKTFFSRGIMFDK